MSQPFTMAELQQKLDLLRGQGAGHVTSHDQPGHVTYQPPPLRRDVGREIYDAIYGAGKALSRGEIAKLLKLKKTPWLIDHIEQLAAKGYLVKTEGKWRNGFLMYYYQVKS